MLKRWRRNQSAPSIEHARGFEMHLLAGRGRETARWQHHGALDDRGAGQCPHHAVLGLDQHHRVIAPGAVVDLHDLRARPFLPVVGDPFASLWELETPSC